MASSVTTATVATMTTAITMESLGQFLSLIAIVALAIGLLAKEAVRLSDSPTARAWSRGLDIGTMPLLVLFGLISILNMVIYLQSA